MKKIISLLLALTILTAIGLLALAVDDPAFSVSVVETVDTATRFGGLNTLSVCWQVQANKPNMTLTNTQGIRLAYDNTILQLIHWNAAAAYADNSFHINVFDELFEEAGCLGGIATQTMDVYAAKDVSGNIGFLSLAVGHEGEFYNCTSGVPMSLMSIRFAFREGKSEKDLTDNSIKAMTLPELNYTYQSSCVLINACINGNPGTSASYEYLRQKGGVAIGADALNAPEIVVKALPMVCLSTATGKAGNEVTLTATLENNPGIASYTLSMKYPNDLELISVQNGDILTSNFMTKQKPGQISFGATSPQGQDVSTGSVLFKITFLIKAGVEEGVIDSTNGLSVGFYRLEDLIEHNDAKIQCNFNQGSIIVKNIVYGDVNGDGNIDSMDLTRLLRYIWGVDSSTNNFVIANADVNGDGNIDLMDVTRLLRYLWNTDTRPLGPIQD